MYNEQSGATTRNEHDGDTFNENITGAHTTQEDIWRKSYDERRDQWKKMTSTPMPNSGNVGQAMSIQDRSEIDRSVIRDGSAFQNTQLVATQNCTPTIRQQLGF